MKPEGDSSVVQKEGFVGWIWHISFFSIFMEFGNGSFGIGIRDFINGLED